jgi:predicted PurR-regulated permease PerM
MAVNVVQSALSSRRVNRWLFALGALVLAAGIIAILVTKIGNNSGTTENANPTGPPISQLEKA